MREGGRDGDSHEEVGQSGLVGNRTTITHHFVVSLGGENAPCTVPDWVMLFIFLMYVQRIQSTAAHLLQLHCALPLSPPFSPLGYIRAFGPMGALAKKEN